MWPFWIINRVALERLGFTSLFGGRQHLLFPRMAAQAIAQYRSWVGHRCLRYGRVVSDYRD